MSVQTPRTKPLSQIEPQYLQAAAVQAAQLNALAWQKMTLIFAVQSATILAAYVLRGALLSWITVSISLLFCLGVVISIHYDLEGRKSLVAQANHIGRQLLRLPRAGIVMSFEPYPRWSLSPRWTLARVVVLVLIDVLAVCAFNLGELANPYLPIPLLPPKGTVDLTPKFYPVLSSPWLWISPVGWP